MSFNLNKKDKIYREIEKYAKLKNMTVKELLDSEDEFDYVTDLLYKGLPRPVRVFLSIKKFRAAYRMNKKAFIESIGD